MTHLLFIKTELSQKREESDQSRVITDHDRSLIEQTELQKTPSLSAINQIVQNELTNDLNRQPVQSTNTQFKADDEPRNNKCILSKPNDHASEVDKPSILETLVENISNLNLEVKAQRECLANFTSFTQKLLEQINQQQMQHNALAETVREHISIQNDLIKELRKDNLNIENQDKKDVQLENVTKELKMIAEQCDHLQSGQHEIRSKVNMFCSDHNHLLADSDHAIKVTQQLTLLAEKHSEQLNQIQNDIVNINLATSSKPETTEIETNDDTSHTKKIRDFPSNAPTAFLESNMNETEGDLPVDENTSFDDTSDIKYHPYAHRMSKNSRGVHSHVPVFKVPFSCSNVVIGDSNLQSIVRRKLDPSGSTVIRTYRGANMKRIINILDSCQICFPNVQKVMFSIGAVDCNKDVIKESYIFDDLDMLIDCAKRVFPSARIGFLSIPPQLNHKANVSIERINNRIFNYLKSSKSTTFLKCVDLWDCVDRMGKPERSILQNGLLLSDLGITLLFKPVLQFLFEGSLIKNRRHQTSGTSAYNRLNLKNRSSRKRFQINKQGK